MKTLIWMIPVAVACVGAWLFLTAGRLSYPPPEVAALELARGDIASSPSCLTVDQVLKANGLTDNNWTTRVKDEWTLRLEPGGSSWRTYRFVVEGRMLVPMQVVSSDDLPQIETEAAIDEWIAKIHTPPAESCRRQG
jgi:hypothetical protein